MATPEEIKIRIIAADEASKVMSKVSGSSEGLRASITKLKYAFVGLSIAGGVFLKSVIQTGAQVQALRVRLRFLTGSIESSARAFEIMNQYASKTPFTLEDIEAGGAQLLTVANNVEELNGLLKITGDLAAVGNLSFAESASQLQRAFSSGIASADLFRERGIAAFLGFQSGVSYSAEETRKAIVSAFRDGTTSAAGATDELAKTFFGNVSMMQDAWRTLKLQLADTGLVDEATAQIQNLTAILKDPEVIRGVKTFTKALLDLFQFVTRNAQVLIAVGAVWLGGKAGSDLGSLFGKRGRAVGAITGGLTALLATLNLLDDETKATLTDMTIIVDSGSEDIVTGFENLSEGIKNSTSDIKKLKKEVVEIPEAMQQMNDAFLEAGERGIKTLEDGLLNLINGTTSAKDAFRSMAKSIIDDLIRMQIRASITAPLMRGLGGLFGGAPSSPIPVTDLSSPAGSLPSFAGGGFTGMSGRSGGIDGRGGFPAILHPNETVVDHTRGQGMGGVNVTLNISTGVSQTVRAEIANLLPQITAATKAAVADARQRGGGYSKSLVGA